MVLFYLSKSHLTCAHWSPTGDRPLLTGTTQEFFSRPLTEVFYYESEFTSLINTSLHKVLEVIPFEGEEVQVVIPNSFVTYGVQSVEAELSLSDAWDYVSWKQAQRWGELAPKRLLFGWSSDNHKIIQYLSCPAVLTTVLKLTIAEQGGRPVWMGTESLVFQSLLNRRYSAVVFSQFNSYELYRITAEGFTCCTLRFSQGNLRIVSGFGDVGWVENLLEQRSVESAGKEQLPLLFVDSLSDRKKQHWDSIKTEYFPTLEGVNTEGITIPETVNQRTRNIITAVISTPPVEQSVNMFGSAGLQERKEPSFTPPELESHREKKKPKKKVVSPKERQQTTLQILTVIVFIVALVVAIYLNTNSTNKPVTPSNVTDPPITSEEHVYPEINQVDSLQEIESAPALKILPYPTKLLKLRDLSNSITFAVEHLFTNVDIQSITFLSISDQNLHVEIAGIDTLRLDTTGIGYLVGHEMKAIQCCDGTLHSFDFTIATHSESFPDSIQTMTEIMSALNDSFPDLDIVQLEPRIVGQWQQFPFILRLKGYSSIRALLATLHRYGNHAFLHKIILRRAMQKTTPQAVFYLSVFQLLSSPA